MFTFCKRFILNLMYIVKYFRCSKRDVQFIQKCNIKRTFCYLYLKLATHGATIIAYMLIIFIQKYLLIIFSRLSLSLRFNDHIFLRLHDGHPTWSSHMDQSWRRCKRDQHDLFCMFLVIYHMIWVGRMGHFSRLQ